MKRRRLGILLVLAAIGSVIGGLRVAAPQRYEDLASSAEQYVSGLPDPVVLAIVYLCIIVVWIATMILVGKILYWAWQQVNDYVYWAFDLVLPESPIIRFGVGIIILTVVFLLGPLFVLQTVDLGESEDPVNESDVNDTDGAENATNGTEAANNESQPTLLADESVSSLGVPASPPGQPATDRPAQVRARSG